MRKIVDVFLQDRFIASYPVVVEASEPADEDFIDVIKGRMRRQHSAEDIAAAKFVVRSSLDP